MSSLRDKYIWASIDKFGTVILAFVFNLILARLYLTPRDFGIMGMIQIFIGIGMTTTIAGLGQAIIQKKDLNQRDLDTVFIINLVVSIVVYLILYFTAPLIASFYDEVLLIKIIRAQSLVFVINAFYVVQYNKLLREFRLKEIAIITIFATLVGYSVGIILASKGFQVWSLVFATLITSFVQVLLLWYTSKWRPNFNFSFTSFKSLFSFSIYIYMSSLLHEIHINLLYIILGRKYTAKTLGYYTQANKFNQIPTTTVLNIAHQVLFPNFSKLQDDPKLLSISYQKSLKLISLLSMLAFGLIYLLSEPLILFLYTSKWAESIPLLRVLSFSGPFLILAGCSILPIKAIGKAKLYFNISFVQKLLGVLFLIYLSKYSMLVLLWGLVIMNIAFFLMNATVLSKVTSVSFVSQLGIVIPFVLIMLLLIFPLDLLFSSVSLSVLLHMVLVTIAYSVLFVFISVVLKLVSVSTIKSVLKKE